MKLKLVIGWFESNHDSFRDLSPCALPITLKPITEEEIVEIIATLSHKSAAGDDIPSSFLVRDCSLVFGKPLTVIINKSIESCQ